jgi:hypothetical protein
MLLTKLPDLSAGLNGEQVGTYFIPN